MTNVGDAPTGRRFLIDVERPWKLWIIPIVAVLYLAWVVAVIIVPVQTNLNEIVWVYAGLGLFALLFFLEIMLLFSRKPRAAKAARAARARPAPVAEPLESEALEGETAQYAAPASAPVIGAKRGPDVEIRATTDEHKGRRVIETSLPPKSKHKGAVYAKAYVPVDDAHVLRVEDLVAEKSELR